MEIRERESEKERQILSGGCAENIFTFAIPIQLSVAVFSFFSRHHGKHAGAIVLGA